MTTNIKKQAFSELDTGLRSELSGRLLHTARWLRGPLFCFDPFCSVAVVAFPETVEWQCTLETPGQEISRNPHKSSSTRGCSTLCLRCVEGGPNAVDARGPWSRLEIPTIFSRMRSIRIHKCRYGHGPCSLFQLLFGIHLKW